MKLIGKISICRDYTSNDQVSLLLEGESNIKHGRQQQKDNREKQENKGTREILILSNQGKAAVPELAMIHKRG